MSNLRDVIKKSKTPDILALDVSQINCFWFAGFCEGIVSITTQKEFVEYNTSKQKDIFKKLQNMENELLKVEISSMHYLYLNINNLEVIYNEITSTNKKDYKSTLFFKNAVAFGNINKTNCIINDLKSSFIHVKLLHETYESAYVNANHIKRICSKDYFSADKITVIETINGRHLNSTDSYEEVSLKINRSLKKKTILEIL